MQRFFHLTGRPRTSLVRRLLLVLALIVVAVLSFKGWRLYSRAQALRQDVRELEAFAATKPDVAALASLGPLLSRTREDAIALHAEAAPLFPIARRLGWVPVYGADLVAAEPILDVATNLAITADEAITALSPVVYAHEPEKPFTVALTERLVAAQPRIEIARQAIARASAAWARIPIDTLPAQLSAQLKRVGLLLPLAQDGLDAALALPDLLGAHGPRNYLLIAQNPDELRATGGLITGAGLLMFDGGRLDGVSMVDSISVDDIANQVYPDPPGPLQRYMNMEMWLFRDANWSPDFPTAAQTAMDLYRLGQGRDTSGVIAIDPATLQLILAAIGPVSVHGSPDPISAKNVIPYIRNGSRSSNAPLGQTPTERWYVRRKTLLEPLAQAIVARLADPTQLDIKALAEAARQALDQRHLQIYVKQAVAASILARRGWDGAVRPNNNDFLMVIDSNLGYNKVNPNIDQTVAYSIDLSNLSAPVADLAIRYTNRLRGPAICDQTEGYNIIISVQRYEELMVGCYWDYLRVLLPHGSELISATAQPVPGEWMDSGVGDDGATTIGTGEHDTRVLSTFLVVPFGQEREKTFRYRLPPTILTKDGQTWHYRLTLQKQAGITALPVLLKLRLPPQASIVSTSVPPAATAGQTMSFRLNLDRDQQIDIAFQTP
jgi:Protein of unknown function (DUF4012)